jgi:hypothetical protein
MDDYLIIECPHCKLNIFINKNEINCTIFRHGVYKNNFTQMNPHENKIQCDYLFNNNLIYGCGKPFKLMNDYSIIICDYI